MHLVANEKASVSLVEVDYQKTLPWTETSTQAALSIREYTSAESALVGTGWEGMQGWQFA